MIVSVDAENTFDKIKTCIHRIKGELQLDLQKSAKPTAKSNNNNERLNTYPLRSEKA